MRCRREGACGGDAAVDAKRDALSLDGRPFSAQVVGEQFGYIFAVNEAIALTLVTVIEDAADDAREAT